jgi:gluconate:H+ symporter, GntP family
VWTASDTRLVVTAAAVVVLVIVLITSRLRLHAFPALMVGSLVLGLAAGPGPEGTVESFTDGVGSTLGDVGIVLGLGLGTMLGKLLADSGGADQSAPRASTATSGPGWGGMASLVV